MAVPCTVAAPAQWFTRPFASAFFALISACEMFGQSASLAAAANNLAFDAASVKPNKSGDIPHSNVPLDSGDYFVPTGGFFNATSEPLFQYVIFAYRITGNQMQFLLPQLPGWVTTDRFDIQARVAGNPGKEQIRLMMRSLLADRFKLAIHNETRQVPVFAVVLLKPGKTGPQLQPHPVDSSCATPCLASTRRQLRPGCSQLLAGVSIPPCRQAHPVFGIQVHGM